QILLDALARSELALRRLDGLAQAREIIGQLFVGDGGGDAPDDEVGRLFPAEIAQHHLRGEDERALVDPVLACEPRRRAVRGLEYREPVADVAARSDADAA